MVVQQTNGMKVGVHAKGLQVSERTVSEAERIRGLNKSVLHGINLTCRSALQKPKKVGDTPVIQKPDILQD